MENLMDKIINLSTSALVGIIILCSVVIPISISQLNGLDATASSQYGGLLGAIIIVVIVSVLLAVVRGITSSKE